MSKTSIIMCSHDSNVIQRRITTVALGNIQKYTDREDYELILVDNGPLQEVVQKYDCIELAKHIQLKEDIGYSASMNLGVKESNPECEYVAFIHNDVFVHEGWLPKLISELNRKNLKAIVPTQGYMTRDQVKLTYKDPDSRFDNDAGLILMTKETFAKSGGWDEKLWSVYHDWGFRQRLSKAGLTLGVTSQVIITHIGWVTLGTSDERFEKFANQESKQLKEVYGQN